jgi:acetylornithine deacetylase/succinyl-diaminopimelate desuccinylase-like protein
VDGRWYGRGAADRKGNILMHLVALRALGGGAGQPKLIVEGSEDRGGRGRRRVHLEWVMSRIRVVPIVGLGYLAPDEQRRQLEDPT